MGPGTGVTSADGSPLSLALVSEMTDDTARKVANAAMGLAALGAAYVILSRPPLRRLALRLALTALTGALPGWLNQEVRQAWAHSGRQMR